MIGIIALAQLQLSAEEKLALLTQLDRWRPWKSLEDQRLCLGCGRLITGHEIEAVRMEADGREALEAHCPTPHCQSIPLDWTLPRTREQSVEA